MSAFFVNEDNSYIVDSSLLDIYVLDNNEYFVKPRVTVAMHPVFRTIYGFSISLEPLGTEEIKNCFKK